MMLDTAGRVRYRQGDFAGAEQYLWSAYAIAPSIDMSLHLSATLLKLGRVDEALKYFAAVSANPVSSEVQRDFAKVLGGDAELESRVKAIQAAPKGPTLRVTVLVDEHGKVLDANSADAPETLLKQAQALTLPGIAWADFALRSIRTVEFDQQGAEWVVARSLVRTSAVP